MPKRFMVWCAISISAVFCLYGAKGSPQAQDTLLVKIGRRPQTSIEEPWRSDINVLQQLETCALAEIPAILAPRLRARGIPLEVLDTAPADKPYYLVYWPGAEKHEIPPAEGNLRPVEEGIYLFWSGKENAREILPPRVWLKRLPDRTDLSLELESAPAARSAGRAEDPNDASVYDPEVAQMVQEVSQAGLAEKVLALQSFGTRFTSTEGCVAAGTYIHDYFSALGLQTEYDTFNFAPGYWSQSVIATLPGRTSPTYTVIVCAHYDSFSNEAEILAPGADDNASGTAAVMEVARILSDHPFDFTVKFIAFSGEELGLLGSRHYALQARGAGEKILGVINLDMIGYADSMPEDLDIVVDRASSWLADRFMDSAEKYASLNMFKRVDASARSSDHSSFWDQSYSALCAIEDYPPVNPHYHSTHDSLETLNLDFLLASTRAVTAAVAELAQPPSTPAAPSNLSARSQITRSLFFRFKTVRLTWGESSTADHYNLYRSETQRDGYRQIANVSGAELSYTDRFLEPDTSYFYFLTAVDSEGRESHHTIEVRDDEDN